MCRWIEIERDWQAEQDEGGCYQHAREPRVVSGFKSHFQTSFLSIKSARKTGVEHSPGVQVRGPHGQVLIRGVEVRISRPGTPRYLLSGSFFSASGLVLM